MAATARETVEACDTSVGVFPRDREAQEAGSRHALGTGNRQGRPEVPGQTGVAGSSRQQPGAGRRVLTQEARETGGRAYPGIAGNREPLGELPKPREGGNTSSRIF